MVPAQASSFMWRSRLWTSDAMLISVLFGGVPIFVRSGGVPIFVRSGGVPIFVFFQIYELTSECRRCASLVHNCS